MREIVYIYYKYIIIYIMIHCTLTKIILTKSNMNIKSKMNELLIL